MTLAKLIFRDVHLVKSEIRRVTEQTDIIQNTSQSYVI